MRVLLAVDGSPYSDAAVNEVALRIWPENTEGRVITAYELPLAPAPETWALPPDYFEKMDRAARENAEAIESGVVTKLATSFGPVVKVQPSAGPARIRARLAGQNILVSESPIVREGPAGGRQPSPTVGLLILSYDELRPRAAAIELTRFSGSIGFGRCI